MVSLLYEVSVFDNLEASFVMWFMIFCKIESKISSILTLEFSLQLFIPLEKLEFIL